MIDHPLTYGHGRVHPIFKPTLEQSYHETGMTIREAFAMAALQGLLAGSTYFEVKSHGAYVYASLARVAADCLIEELNK